MSRPCFISDPAQRSHVACTTVELGGHDGSGARCNGCFDGCGVDQMIWAALDGDGLGAGEMGGDRSSQHRMRAQDDLVALADARSQ